MSYNSDSSLEISRSFSNKIALLRSNAYDFAIVDIGISTGKINKTCLPRFQEFSQPPVHLYQGTTYNIQRSLINIRLANFGLQLIDIVCFGHDYRPFPDFVSFYFI